MGRKAKRRCLHLWMNGERVGTWTKHAHGAQEFAYAPDWPASPAARPISLSMPLRPGGDAYTDERVANFFDNLLPDNDQIRTRIQRKFRTDSTEPIALLAEIGRDCVGAIQLLQEGQVPFDIQQIGGQPLNSAAIEQILSDTLATSIGAHPDSDDFRISLAGAQEKTALLWHNGCWHKPLGSTPTTHILKLPLGILPQGIDLSTSVENEWLCGQILRAYQIPVAPSEIAQFGQYKTLVVERFDRQLARNGQWLIRLPQEDLCQATGTPPGLKYENEGGPGIAEIMTLLLGSNLPHQDRLDFLKTQLVFWLLCAIDGHAKNFSLFLLPGGGYRLTPRYDVMSAYPVLGHGSSLLAPQRVKMAMAMVGDNRHYHWSKFHFTHWLDTARLCGMATEMSDLIDQVLKQTTAVIAQVGAAIPNGFPAAVARPILNGLASAAHKLATQRQTSTGQAPPI